MNLKFFTLLLISLFQSQNSFATNISSSIYAQNRRVHYVGYKASPAAEYQGRFIGFPGAGCTVGVWKPLLKQLSMLGFDAYAFDTESYLAPTSGNGHFSEIPYRVEEMRALIAAAANGELIGTTSGFEKVTLSTHSNGGVSAALLLSGYRAADQKFVDLQFSQSNKLDASSQVSSFVAMGFSEDISRAAHLLTAKLKDGPENTGIITRTLPKLFQFTVSPNSLIYRNVSRAYIHLLDRLFPADVRWREHIEEPGVLDEFLLMLKQFNLRLSARRTTDTLRIIDENLIDRWRSETLLVPTTYLQAGWDVAISERALYQLIEEQKRNNENAHVSSFKIAGTDHITLLLSPKAARLVAQLVQNPLALEAQRGNQTTTFLDWRNISSAHLKQPRVNSCSSIF